LVSQFSEGLLEYSLTHENSVANLITTLQVQVLKCTEDYTMMGM
jgi:hypothetical protein